VYAQEALSRICEYSEAGITVRGTYYPPPKEPREAGERKLYLGIEATSELAIQKAKTEIIRLIKEELQRLVSQTHTLHSSSSSSSKYSSSRPVMSRTRRRQGFLCLCTASLEQAAYRAEAAAVDQYLVRYGSRSPWKWQFGNMLREPCKNV